MLGLQTNAKLTKILGSIQDLIVGRVIVHVMTEQVHQDVSCPQGHNDAVYDAEGRVVQEIHWTGDQIWKKIQRTKCYYESFIFRVLNL